MYTIIKNSQGELLDDLSLFDKAVQTAGRQLDVIINVGDTSYTAENISSAAISFDGDILTSIMKSCTIELKDVTSIDSNVISSVKLGAYIQSLNDYYYIDYGSFIVDTSDPDTGYNQESKTFNLICYDSTIKTMCQIDLALFDEFKQQANTDTSDTETDVQYLITPYDAVERIASICGLSFDALKLEGLSESYVFDLKLFENRTYRDVLSAIAGISGGFIYIDNENYITLGKIAESDYTADADNLTRLQLGKARTITAVDLVGSVDAVKYSLGLSYEDITLRIEENPIVQFAVDNDLTDIITSIQRCFSDIAGLTIQPFEFNSFGFPRLSLGDCFTLLDIDSNECKLLCFNNTITISQGLTQSMHYDEPSACAKEYEYKTDEEKKLDQAVATISRLEGQIRLKVSKGDVVSEINQTEDTIRLRAGHFIVESDNFGINEAGEAEMAGFEAKKDYLSKTFTSKSGTETTLKVGYVSGSSNGKYIFMLDTGDSSYPFAVTDNGIVEGDRFVAQSTEFRKSGVYSATDNVTVQSVNGILQMFGGSQANMRIGISGIETYGVTLQKGTSDVFFAPYTGSNEDIYLGTNSRRWKTVYCTGTNTSSDAKVKENIRAIDCNDEFIEFCENIVPSYYTMKNGDTGRVHSGFIAQPLAELANKTIGDLSLFQAEGIDDNGNPCYYDPALPDDRLNWGLDYQQLIPILWRYVQYLSERIKHLEERKNDNS